jgi:hypothetical protein
VLHPTSPTWSAAQPCRIEVRQCSDGQPPGLWGAWAFGGLSVALAPSVRLLDEQVRTTAAHWDRAFEMFRLMV